jgi:GTPase SAR1 family protein
MSIFRQDYFYKIALVGDSSVGKSSLLKRYCDDHFEETYHATIGVDFKFK